MVDTHDIIIITVMDIMQILYHQIIAILADCLLGLSDPRLLAINYVPLEEQHNMRLCSYMYLYYVLTCQLFCAIAIE